MVTTISKAPVGTGMLAFRDLQEILKKHVCGINALDFGCGVGRSSRTLKSLGYAVTAVDVSQDLIEKASSFDDEIQYILIAENDLAQIESERYDLILVSFVIMELSSREKIISTLKLLKEHLSTHGKLVLIVASDHLYHKRWLSMDTAYLENEEANSGDVVKIYLKDYALEISDYLWKEKDCEYCFNAAHLGVLDKISPLGHKTDGKEWVDETSYPPFIIYVLEDAPGVKNEKMVF